MLKAVLLPTMSLASLLLISPAVLAVEPAKLDIDPNRVTVSGVSAGAQMAHQLHIAYSDLFSGAALIAGGPFGCADGSLATAMARCVGTADPSYPVAETALQIRSAEESGGVAAVAQLENDPVWLFHGAKDTTVAAGVSDSLADLYAEFIAKDNVVYIRDVDAGHNFPASGRGSACLAMESPFVGNCNYDAAGQLLQHLYPDLESPENVISIDLTEVTLDGATDAGLSETAYLFIPPACVGTEKACALHLVLHGCAQSAVSVGDAFIQQSGYLPWAEANDIVLAFPQVVAGAFNPLGCWDWWGYTGADYLYRDGKQMTVLADWIRSL